MSTVFARPLNNATTTLGSAYSSGAGSVRVATGDGALFGTVSPTAPVRFTMVRAAAVGAAGQVLDRTALAIYEATGRTGDTLTGVTVQEGTTDQAFATGDLVAVLVTAGTIGDLQTAVNAAETTLAAHVASTSNPHAVSAAQVGSSTAQWNANGLQGRLVDAAAPSDGQALVWVASTSKWTPAAVSGGSGSPGGSTTQVQFNAAGSFAGDAQFTWDATNHKLSVPYVTTAATSLVLEQTGDAGGTSRLTLKNRTGLNGALFENPALDLVDFGLASSGGQLNLRFEHRSAFVKDAANTTGEFQVITDPIGTPAFPWAIGASRHVLYGVSYAWPATQGGVSTYLKNDGSGNLSWSAVAGGGSGTVTTVSVASANGFAGTVANATTTPAITITTSVTGLLKGNGTALSAATEGTDYLSGASNKLPLPFTFGGSGVPTVASDVTPWLYVGLAATGTRLTLTCKVAPTGSFQITIKRSSDSGSTFPDTIATVTVSSGARSATTTTFTNAALAAGDLLRCDVISVNGADTWTARLSTLSRNQ